MVGSFNRTTSRLRKLSNSTRSHLSFRRLWDGSVCILCEDERLGLPYCFFHYLSGADELNHSDLPAAEKAFLLVLRYLNNYVDHNVFNPGNSPWQEWELFVSCFSVLRINALLITSDAKEVRLSRIFEGARFNCTTDHMVCLCPKIMAQTEHILCSSSPAKIRLKNQADDTN